MTRPLRIGVYGTGRMAGSLVVGLSRACGRDPDSSLRLVGLTGRDVGAATRIAQAHGVAVVDACALMSGVDLLVVAVSDGAIARVAESLATGVSELTREQRPRWAVHCSGAVGTEALTAMAAMGVGTGCWHPLQAVADATTAPRAGTVWTVTTADETLRAALERLTSVLAGVPRPLDPEHRAAYHAAAVLASNHAAALVIQAVDVLGDCGFSREDAVAVALSLARSALDALESTGGPDGVTGPVVRGDVETVQRHVHALSGRPGTCALYAAASRALLPEAERRGVDSRTLAALDATLGGRGGVT